MLSFLLNCKRIYNDFIKDEVTVYAAQASFFIVLSAAPFIMILLTLIQLIPAVSPICATFLYPVVFPVPTYWSAYTDRQGLHGDSLQEGRSLRSLRRSASQLLFPA